MPAPDRRRRLTAFAVVMAVLIVTPLAVIASDRFEDVSDSNIFHDDIGWLADAEVTLGCNPPDNDQFCPSENVTRQQMAAFMRRLAENQVVDAGSVEGKTAADLAPVVSYASALDSVDFPGNFDVITARTVTVDAPAAGAVVAEARGDIVANGATVTDDHQFACWVDTDPNSLESNEGAHVSVAAGTVISGNVFATNFATSHAVTMEEAGSASFYLLCRDTAGGTGNDFRVNNAQLSATFYPGDGHSIEADTSEP